MATPDFRLQPDDGPVPDFTLNADEADSTATKEPVIAIPEDVLPEPEQALGETKQQLVEDGFDPGDVEAVTTPFKLGPDLPESLNLSDIYDKLGADQLKQVPVVEESRKLKAAVESEGVPVGEAETQSIQRVLALYGEGTIRGLAEARTWWQRAKQTAANVFAGAVSEAAIDFSLGLGLLDAVSYVDKKVQLQFIPKEQRAEVEARVLPKITLENGKEFSLGTSAALNIITQRAYSGIEKFSGGVTKLAGSLFGSNTLKELGEETLARGQERGEEAVGQVPALVTGLGGLLSWQEVVERRADPDEVDSIYATMNDMGGYGDLAMGTIAVGSALADVFLSPFTLISGMPTVPSALRRVLGKQFPGKAAQVLSKVARRTYDFEDAVNAVKAAEKHLETVVERATKQASATGGRISIENYRKIVLARKQLSNEKLWLSTFEDAGPNTPILRRTARRNPSSLDYVPQAKIELAYVEDQPGGVLVRKATDIADELREVRRAELQRGMDNPLDWDRVDDLPLFQQRQLLGPDDAEQAGDALNLITRTGGVGIDDVATTPQAPEISLVPDSQRSLIDWRALDRARQITKAERQLLSTSGGKQYDLLLSTRRSLARQSDIIKRNLGFARSNKDKAAIKVFTEELRSIKKTMKKLENSGLDKKAQKFDARWLPPKQPGIMQDPGRFNRWLEVAGDRVMRTLYPGGLGLNALADTKAGQIFAPLREPQRFFQQYDPAAWDRIKSSYLRYQRESRSFYEMILEGAEEAGVVTRRAKFDPRKEFSPLVINEERNRLLFDLLDNPKDSKKWTALAEQADEALLKLHDKIRKELDHAADMQGISDTNKYLTGYIRHVFDASQFAGGARPVEYVGLPGKAETFASHLLNRTGKGGYPKDALLALDLYGRAMYRKLIIEPMYEDVIQTGAELAKKFKNPTFQTYTNDLVSQLQGKPRLVGAKIDEWIGGAVNKPGQQRWTPGAIDRTLMGLSGLFWSSALPGNPRYPIMQIAAGVVTTASRFGLFRTSKALWQMASEEGQAINKQIGTYENFLNILESDFARKWSKFVAERGYTVTPFGVMSTAQTEEFVRGMTALAAIDMHMTKLGISSWEEAKQLNVTNRIAFEALRSSEEVNHMFGSLGRSPWATRTLSPIDGLAVSATQFLSFIPKQTEELVAQFNRDPGMLAKYLAMSGWISRVAAQELGVDVTNYVGLGYLPETPDELTSPAVDAFVKGVDFLYQASPMGTPSQRADATAKFLDALDGLIPMLVAFESAGKSGQRLLTKEQTTARGERSRALELGDLDKEVNAENILRAINPVRSDGPGAVDSQPGLGGDLIPTLFGQQSIRENLFRRGQQAIRRENDRFLQELSVTMGKFANAVDDGDMEKASELEKELMNKFGQVLASDTAMEKALIAREFAWTIRQLDQAPDQVKARVVKIIKEFGLPLEP